MPSWYLYDWRKNSFSLSAGIIKLGRWDSRADSSHFFLAQGENFSAEQSWEETNNERERRRQNL